MSISQNFPSVLPTLNLDFAKTKTLDPRISFSRGSSATYTDATGTIQTAASNVPRFDHDPATGQSLGLLVEESRTNYIQSSQNFTSAFWNSSNNVTIVPNSITSPAGDLTASLLIPSTAAAPSVAWSTLAVSSSPYTVSCYVKPKGFSWCFLYDAQGNKKAYFNLTGSGSVGNIDAGITSASISSLPNGWYRVIVTSTVTYLNYIVGACNANGSTSATGDGVSGIYIWGAQLEAGSFPTSYIPTPATFTSRSSTATYYDANGVIQTANSGVARSNAYFPDSNGVMRPAGLLLEGAGTNQIPNSQNFSGTGWNQDGLSITANAGTAPDGTNTASSIVQGTGNNRIIFFDNTGVTGNKTFSIFAKSNAGTSFSITGVNISFGTNSQTSITLNTNNGTVTGGATGCSYQALGNGWYRFIIPYANAFASGNGAYFIISGPASSVYIWGAQLEVSPYATSYIPTSGSTVTRAADTSTSATVTRSADVAQMTGTNFSGWFNSNEGSVLSTSRWNGTSLYGNPFLWAISDGSLANYFAPYAPSNTGRTLYTMSNGIRVDTGTPANTSPKFAFSYSTNQQITFRGGFIGSGTTGALPIKLNTFTFSFNFFASAASPGSIHHQAFTYYPKSLTNVQLQSLTAS